MVVVHPPEIIAHASAKARRAHEREYSHFLSALRIWRKLPLGDRRYVLRKAGFEGTDSEVTPDDFQGIKATGARRRKLLNAIRLAPRDSRFRARYRAMDSHAPRDVYVRPHERKATREAHDELVARGWAMRRPRNGSVLAKRGGNSATR